MGNRRTIESLMPRIEGLAESLSTPAPENETREIERREALERYVTRCQGRDLTLTVYRKLDKVLGNLKQLEERGKVEGFLNNVKDAEALTGLTEDIRDAMMDYQVCIHAVRPLKPRLMSSQDCTTARHLSQEQSDHCESGSPTIPSSSHWRVGQSGPLPSQDHVPHP